MVACWLVAMRGRFAGRRRAKAPASRWEPFGWALGIGLLLGIWRFERCARDPGQAALAALAREHKTVALRGTIIAEPDVKSDKAVALDLLATAAAGPDTGWHRIAPTRCRIVLLAGRGTNLPPVHAKIPDLCRPAAYGYTVRVLGLRPQKPKEAPALSRRKAEPVVLLGHWSGCRIVERTQGHPVMEAALALKERLLAGFRAQLTDRSARLAAGMTLGDKAAVYGADYHGWGMRDLFARAGIAHLLAVSGSNVGVLAATVCWLLSVLRVPRKWILLPALLVVVAYTLMTGLPASAQRAALMTSVGLVLWAMPSFKMPGSLYLGLGLSAALILLRDPEELFRPGFQLSFLAVLTLALGTPVVDRGMVLISSAVQTRSTTASTEASTTKRIAKNLRVFLAAQVAIQFGLSIPASAIYFGHYSVAGLLVNVAAIPLAAVLTPGGLLVGLLDMIPVVGRWLAVPVAWGMERIFDLFLWISATCAAHLPYPEMPVWPWWIVAGYYLLISTTLLYYHRHHQLHDNY